MGRNRLLFSLLFAAMFVALLGLGFVIATFFLGPRTALDPPSGAELLITNAGKNSFLVPGDAQTRSNPLASLSADQLSNAKKVYTARCQTCHAADGKGQTAIGQNTHPRAADLTATDVQARSDGALFWFVANGIPHTGMPGWKNVLKEDEMWQLVAYLRLLPKGEQAVSLLLPTPSPTPTATFTPTSLPSPTVTATQKPTDTPTVAATTTAAPTVVATATTAPTLAATATIAPPARATATPAALAATNVVTVTIKDYIFPPVTVKPGTRVVWVNADDDEHDVVSDNQPHTFESPLLKQGQTYAFVFTQPGTFTYFCDPHDTMHGVVTVK